MSIPNKNLIGLIPAAGKGSRLNLPYPKELYPIIRNDRYKPLSQFVVENLITAGVHHIVFVINETKHQLMSYYGDGERFGCKFSYVYQERINSSIESTSPGLSHALDAAYHLVRDQKVVFGMADTIMFPDDVFSHLIDTSPDSDDTNLGLFMVDTPHKFGMVKLDDSGHVVEIVDKPESTDLSFAWGCMVWPPKFTEYLHRKIQGQKELDFARIMNNAITDKINFRGVIIPGGKYADLGTYEEIAELERKYQY